MSEREGARQEILLRRFIAVAQKTAASSETYGRGYNYWVEVAFPYCDSDLPKDGPDDTDFSRDKILDEVLAMIDHQALGVDVNLGFEPTTSNLCRWLHSQILARLAKFGLIEPALKVRLTRGDGLMAEVSQRK